MFTPAVVYYTTAPPVVRYKPPQFQPKPGQPHLYVVCDSASRRAPLYVGETGKSKSYDAIERVRRHFLTGQANTLNRIYKNLDAIDALIPEEVIVYFFPLSFEFEIPELRQSLEAYVIRETIHEQRIQDTRFCVTKYSSPVHNFSDAAKSILGLVGRADGGDDDA